MYVGRFAPSPTGPLHAGSLATALASWLDARAHGGRWLVRIEDVDGARCPPGIDQFILRQLATCGLVADAPPLWQSGRGALYQRALDALASRGLAYPCSCSRQTLARAQSRLGRTRQRGQAAVYPGTCRPENGGVRSGQALAWRFHTGRFEDRLTASPIIWADRRLGACSQRLASEVGDFVLRRADGAWAYQIAVVVDDAAQGVSDVVRGEDLAGNTPRQIALQRALGLPTPRYLHLPLVLGADGQKLSKQSGARAVELDDPSTALRRAARSLRLAVDDGVHRSVEELLAALVPLWRSRHG